MFSTVYGVLASADSSQEITHSQNPPRKGVTGGLRTIPAVFFGGKAHLWIFYFHYGDAGELIGKVGGRSRIYFRDVFRSWAGVKFGGISELAGIRSELQNLSATSWIRASAI
jgi:hypothetical protein